jgi:hypothetical protein
MKQIDKQYVAFAGEPDGKITLVDWRKPDGENHKILRESGDLSFLTVKLDDIMTPYDYQDALKVSRCKNLSVMVSSVKGGTEDVLDMTDCDNTHVLIGTAEPRGRYLATIKGGCNNCMISVINQLGHGKETDYDLGNWFDYNKRKTTNIHLASEVAGGGYAKCRVLHANKPITPPDQKWIVKKPWYADLFYPVYGLLKKLGLR